MLPFIRHAAEYLREFLLCCVFIGIIWSTHSVNYATAVSSRLQSDGEATSCYIARACSRWNPLVTWFHTFPEIPCLNVRSVRWLWCSAHNQCHTHWLSWLKAIAILHACRKEPAEVVYSSAWWITLSFSALMHLKPERGVGTPYVHYAESLLAFVLSRRHTLLHESEETLIQKTVLSRRASYYTQ